MTYDNLDLSIFINLGRTALVGLDSTNNLLFARQQHDQSDDFQVVNLGRVTKKDLAELKGYLDRLAIHLPEN